MAPEPRVPVLGRAMSLGVRTAARPPAVRARVRSGERSAFGPVIVGMMVIGLGMGAVACREAVTRTIPAAAPLFAALGLPTDGPGGAMQAAGHRGVITTATVVAPDAPPPTITAPDQRVVVRERAEQHDLAWTEQPPKASQPIPEAISFGVSAVAPQAGADFVVSFTDLPSGGRVVRVKDR